jgi:hypothetical protein
MKKIFLLQTIFIGINAFGNIKSVVIPKISVEKIVSSSSPINEEKSNKIPENFKCHVCCTVTVWNADGESSQVTACAGWLLTSCETAAERACNRAAAAVDAVLGN